LSLRRRHRPVRPEWIRDLRDRCQAEGVSFFLKQWGGRTPKAGGRLLDGVEWSEMPVGCDSLNTRNEDVAARGARNAALQDRVFGLQAP
jgi:hypothetical protein